MTGRFAGMAASFMAGVLFMLSQSAHTDLVGKEQGQEKQTERDVNSKANKRKILNTAPPASNTNPSGTSTALPPSFIPPASNVQGSMILTAQGSMALTGAQFWSHEVPYSCLITFPASATQASDFNNFVNSLADASAYYQDLTTSNKTKWSLISSSSNPANFSVTLNFLPECPFKHNHVKGHSAGTGRIIVISLTVPTGDNTINTAPSSLNFIHHGTIGSASTPIQEQ